jgi:hypothetical protein
MNRTTAGNAINTSEKRYNWHFSTGDWYFPVCRFHNFNNVRCCFNCFHEGRVTTREGVVEVPPGKNIHDIQRAIIGEKNGADSACIQGHVQQSIRSTDKRFWWSYTPGDWYCPRCSFHNFKSRSECLSCSKIGIVSTRTNQVKVSKKSSPLTQDSTHNGQEEMIVIKKTEYDALINSVSRLTVKEEEGAKQVPKNNVDDLKAGPSTSEEEKKPIESTNHDDTAITTSVKNEKEEEGQHAAINQDEEQDQANKKEGKDYKAKENDGDQPIKDNHQAATL